MKVFIEQEFNSDDFVGFFRACTNFSVEALDAIFQCYDTGCMRNIHLIDHDIHKWEEISTGEVIANYGNKKQQNSDDQAISFYQIMEDLKNSHEVIQLEHTTLLFYDIKQKD